MKRLFRIDESEKNRILGMHKTATSKQYLKEQEETGAESGNETEVNFDCEKIDDVLEKPEVKNWVKKITGPAKWTIRRGSEKLAEKDMYKGVVDVIKIIQCKLDLEPSGVFDNNTDTKLKSLQSEKGLKSDGIVGPKTWAKMFPDSQDDEGNNVTETKECLDQFAGTSKNKAGGIIKVVQDITYIFYENGRFFLDEANPQVKGNWKCEENKVMTKVTAPYRGPWVVLIP